MEATTIHYKPSQSKPLFNEGQIFKIKGYKRIVGIVESIDTSTPSEISVSIKAAYRPAPKSQVRNKSPFSKIKLKVVK